MDRYRVLQVIGEGTYGKVFKAQERETGRVVAIKKFKQKEDEDIHVRKTMMREIRILREFKHVNIVNLRSVFREKGKLFLIFDYVEKTLLEELQATPDGLQIDRIKTIIYQILQANHFLHEAKIIHRDIKPENLLISKAGLVKLCDFGFARPLNSAKNYQYTDYVSTRWYRAPELLVGDAAYSETVDTWAVGCIFAEIFNGMPLFPGDSDLHTLQLIQETITADDMEHETPVQELSKKQRVAFRMNPLYENMKVPLAAESIKTPETIKEVSLKSLLKNITDEQLDFLRKSLIIDGEKRATMAELLAHPVFDEEFKTNFDERIKLMSEEDEKDAEELTKNTLKTKDGRSELDPEELATEEEKDDDDDDEEDEEFDEDDSSSAIASNNDIMQHSSPEEGSSSGIEQSRLNHMRQKENQEKSEQTAVPPTGVGEGLLREANSQQSIDQPPILSHQSNHNSVQKLQQNVDAKSDDHAKERDSSEGRNKLLLLSSKNLESQPDQQPSDSEQTPQVQQPKERAPAKEVKDLKASSEQLQIEKGADGSASLVPAKSDHEIIRETERDVSTPPAKKEGKMKVPSSPVKDYGLNGGASNGPQSEMLGKSAHQPQQKRASLNHYMIESSITEEIKEENASQNSSSNKSPASTPIKEAHIVVQEPINSMFHYSLGDTEQGTEGGAESTNQEHANQPDPLDQNQILASSIAQIKLGAKIETKNEADGLKLQSIVNSTSDTKATDLKSSEMRTDSFGDQVIRQMSESPNNLQAQRMTSHQKMGTSADTNQAFLIGSQQNSDGPQSRQNNAPLKSMTTGGTRVTKSTGPQVISKVNITFDQIGSATPSIPSAQVNTTSEDQQHQVSRQMTSQDKTMTAPISILQSQILASENGVVSGDRQPSNRLNSEATSSQLGSKKVKQALVANNTAREFTPNKKPSFMVTSSQKPAGKDGTSLHHLNSNGLDSTAAKTSLDRQKYSGNVSNHKDMTVTQFTGKPVYKMGSYPLTQVKGPGPKQAAVLKQTSSLEKLDSRAAFSPQKLPNLKSINSSMGQYPGNKPTTSDDQRIGDGLVNLQQQQRHGPNSINSHFSSHNQHRQTIQMQMGAVANKITSGSTQSLTTKMNFPSSNYHRASNSQNNEPSHQISSIKQPGVNVVSSMTAKKSQNIQPLKLVAFPKLLTEETQQMAGTVTNQAQLMAVDGQTTSIVINKYKNGGGNQLNPAFSRTKPNFLHKKPAPQTVIHVQSSKTHAGKMPKRYSDMGMAPQGVSVLHNNQVSKQNTGVVTTQMTTSSKFGGLLQVQGNSNNIQADHKPSFHPSINNEYMLSQDSLGFHEIGSHASRPPSSKQYEKQDSVENRYPRNQVSSQMSSHTKSRAVAAGSNGIANQSFHSTMQSKNNKFIHNQNGNGVKGGQGNGMMPTMTNPNKMLHTEKKVHQHFLEEFNELNSQRQSINRGTAGKQSVESQGSNQKPPMTSQFQKSKFFQSQSNAENNPNSMNVPASSYHVQQNHYGQSMHLHSSSPNNTLANVDPSGVQSQSGNRVNQKDSFPRRNITNKLRNANNVHPKKNKAGDTQISAVMSSSPINYMQSRGGGGDLRAQQNSGIVLPNLGQTSSSTAHHPTGHPSTTTGMMTAQQQHHHQHIMQVSLTQLGNASEMHRNQNLSQSPHTKKDPIGNKLRTASNVVQLNASEFNLRLTNNSKLSSSSKIGSSSMPYQQIVRKPPSVIQPGRTNQYQMYLTPSQNYTAGTNQSGAANRATQAAKQFAKHKVVQGSNAVKGIGMSPSNALSKKISYDNSFHVQKIPQASVPAKRSPQIKGGVSYKVKTETDWHRGSQQQLFDVSNNLGQSNQLYRVSNQLMEKSISPHRIQQAMKRGSMQNTGQVGTSQGGVMGGGGQTGGDLMTLTNQRGGQTMNNDSSQDSLAVAQPNLLRKKFVAKQQNQIK